MSAFMIPEMEPSEFVQWQSMLERRTGLWLPETRKAFLVTSLNRHMREKGITVYREYYQLLDSGQVTSLEWARLVDSLTVHETCFYRDLDSLNLVTSYCRNRALHAFRDQPTEVQDIQVWSVGCSTGEETYSLAMELEKLTGSLSPEQQKLMYYGVTGVDVSYPSLAVAREGIYSNKNSDFLPSTSFNHFFEKLADNHIQVKSNIKKRTCFMQANILELDEKPKQFFDVIYCQNVMIYFRQERKAEIIEDFEKRLKPGGILILGHGEVTQVANKNLTRVDNKHCLAFIKSQVNITKESERA
ncbi:MAG: protein-glutamate O-methyltransferase CheR [Kangiellaceae bacterium]|nr:protein-glutamate O-methyltransferase CheR [Kangiellaceae bacterium]